MTAYETASTSNPYLLLTPGPLTTTRTVKEAMLKDWCTWDEEYNRLVASIRERLVQLAVKTETELYTAVLMQGSGTFSVEAAIGTALPREGGRLAIAVNGAYGERIVQIAEVLGIPTTVVRFDERSAIDPAVFEQALRHDPSITHAAVVHCETTTGVLNPLAEIAEAVKRRGVTFIVDAMSSFGGVALDMKELGIDYLVSSSNKCVQGVPGFGFVITRREAIAACKGHARSLSLDLYDQWDMMERSNSKWRYTSPTHVVRAFDQALRELELEGGIAARQNRYSSNQRVLTEGMEDAGFSVLLPREWQSPIITAFRYPDAEFSFEQFYARLKKEGFVLYPGKLTSEPTFRIGSIGDVHPSDMERLVAVIKSNQLTFY
ncbi:2-aminoethylphosphonate--pyruvate transaminase [Paenibacillus alkaliterrae]|uniref:2-aminoethylphosphonate--pyruvate transaminase n=1 Tax=Paenibacillus alkaliterrae TaxID=320909 RepID=UPI001F2930ED|nr:2-aminoethylphosphonate--pyruvate transaminase [Paenibacillus alkaliterrae]MCF2938973.1 2-aminoethylphosphonate--pyruvate transaminase [Paenibacillus alkaliterrae]